MTYRDLFAQYGWRRMTDVTTVIGISLSQLSNLYYGRDTLGLALARRISERMKIPLTAVLEATPETPPGRRGRPPSGRA